MITGIALALIPGAAAVVLLRRRLLVITVDGLSMLPTYRPGDRVLVRRGGRTTVRRGDVVVLHADAALRPHTRYLLKRAAAVSGDAVPPGRIVVLGDNPAGSYDSRESGYYATTAVVGVVRRRMAAPSPAFGRHGSAPLIGNGAETRW